LYIKTSLALCLLSSNVGHFNSSSMLVTGEVLWYLFTAYPSCNTIIRKESFYPRTIRDWNALPTDTALPLPIVLNP
jgi:hypothetical protein